MKWWWLAPALGLTVACGDKAGSDDDDDGGGSSDSGTPWGGDVGGDGGTPGDADGDGYPATDDCDDADATVFPGADEYCDGVDNDCDDEIDEDGAVDAPTWCQDGDGDGYGGGDLLEGRCTSPGDDWFDVCDDCDDADVAFHPGAVEDDCTDPADYDCDGETLYADVDGDGTPACEDCDDEDADAFPGADEVCDEVDNDCDGLVDDEDDLDEGPTWYVDRDGDGYGSDSATTVACEAGDGWAATDEDCDDDEADVHPGATEVCDAVDTDEDCDGDVDDDDVDVDASTMGAFYADGDGDGHGEEGADAEYYCDAPDRYSATADDCDDEDAEISPSADEVCDDLDNDCDGAVDDDDDSLAAWSATPYYPDDDGDGFGDVDAAAAYWCEDPGGDWLTDHSDCDDGDASIHPDASEVCDDEDTDEDCDGLVDDDDDSVYTSSHTTWYLDGDGDGHAGGSETTTACDAPGDDWYAEAGEDCDDADDSVYPGATELCNEIDEDCDGSTEGGEGVGILWADGTFEDVTAEVEAATAADPAHFELYDYDTHTVASDIYLCEGTWNATFEERLSRDLSVVGIGDRDAIVLEVSGEGPIIEIDGCDTVEVSNFTMTGAAEADDVYGGALFVEDVDTLTIDGMLFLDNGGDFGGAVFLDSVADFTVSDSEFLDNAATFGGGLALHYSEGTVTESTFQRNRASNSGGGIYHRGNGSPVYDLSIVDTTLTGNTSSMSRGGAVYAKDASFQISSSGTARTTVANNNGGGLVVYETRGYDLDLDMTDVDFGEDDDENEDYDIWIYGGISRSYSGLGAGFSFYCNTDDGCTY